MAVRLEVSPRTIGYCAQFSHMADVKSLNPGYVHGNPPECAKMTNGEYGYPTEPQGAILLLLLLQKLNL